MLADYLTIGAFVLIVGYIAHKFQQAVDAGALKVVGMRAARKAIQRVMK